ncbi:interleukin-1 receptor-associated kinase 4 isoform X1 [Chiloscyllium plagiosum]|uniref:interleukin-1 receptor-associated kinase 4 isoform X1 n=1 Tax=Chiloscyllium plagiosum TaxID=36176 RepID=UPI001CB7DF78|nr:interleukin-1 receptor-associated kinase 4 isoform X1 [Chiloscyllium plagiosum]
MPWTVFMTGPMCLCRYCSCCLWKMNESLTPQSYIRHLKQGLIQELSDMLDPQDGWKKLAVSIKKSTGELRYSQLHIRRFEGLIPKGRSPTAELLFDWGTTNATVNDFVEILIQNNFLAAASLVLPDKVPLATPSASLPEKNDTLIGDSAYKPILQVSNNEHTRHYPDSSSEKETALMVNSSTPPCSSYDSSEINLHNFNYYELMQRTGNFDERPVSDGGSKIGEGGFGIVYRGYINNRMVAVKKLTAALDQHNVSMGELRLQFSQEIKTLAKLKHENLVELLGFSNDGEHPCLVYAYMPNGSLLDRLACLNNTAPLSWNKRCNIAGDTANGLKYLHDNNHIHRDVKSANILLDALFVPKISDFGLSRASSRLTQTMLTEKIVGTTAYMAPEAMRGEITPKSDVFSFGIVLLELITGLPPVDESREPQLLFDIKEEIEDEEMSIEDYIDKKMQDQDSVTIEKMYLTASQCLNEKKNKRPDIKKVNEVLGFNPLCKISANLTA